MPSTVGKSTGFVLFLLFTTVRIVSYPFIAKPKPKREREGKKEKDSELALGNRTLPKDKRPSAIASGND